MRNLRFVVTGAGGGHDIDLRRFAVNGMTLLGRLRGVADGRLLISDNLEDSLAQGDAWFESFKVRMDDYAQQRDGRRLSIAEQKRLRRCPYGHSQLANWTSVSQELPRSSWCSGFRYDFSWIELPCSTMPASQSMSAASRRMRASTSCTETHLCRKLCTLAGVGNDAAFLAERIAAKS